MTDDQRADDAPGETPDPTDHGGEASTEVEVARSQDVANRQGSVSRRDRRTAVAEKKAKPQRRGTAFWIERANEDGTRAVWLVTRAPRGMLGGMRALPDDGWTARADGLGDAPITGAWRAGGVVRHSFTHADLELGVAIFADEVGDVSQGEWWPLDRLSEAGLPTLFAKAAELVLANR